MGNIWNDDSQFIDLLRKLPSPEQNGDKQNRKSKNINRTSLEILALLLCQSSSIDKAIGLYECLNPPGNQRADAKVTHNDQDWRFVLSTIFEIATKILPSIVFKDDEQAL